jgi:phage shock protein A
MVRADAHGMMDQLEEHSLVLRQHLREAELEVARKRASLEALDDERRSLRGEGERLEARVAALDADVELARAGEDEALTRYAVRRLLPEQSLLRELFTRAAELDARRARLAEMLSTQEAQLEELRPRVRARLARPERDRSAECDAAHVTDEEVELELLRRRRANAAGEAS